MNKYLLLVCILLIVAGSIQLFLYDTPLPEEYVETSYGQLAYTTYGEGSKILILIHGSPGSKNDFTKLGPMLEEEYTVYAVDMIGFGKSSKRIKDYGFDGQTPVLLSFMDALNIDTAELLGYSWGGGLVVSFANQYPQRVEHLYLLGAVGIPQASHTQSHYGETLRAIVSYPFAVIYPGSFAPEFLTLDRRHGFVRSFLDSDQRTIADLMKGLTVPTTIIHGDKDTVVLYKGAQQHQQLISGSKLVTYQGSHGLIFNDPTQIAEAILE